MNDNPDMPAGEALNPRARATDPWGEERATALLMLADGTIIEGKGAGAVGIAVGEVCFNTAMTGYQEILTDPSYAGQIITFTFPHIGNVGTNTEDIETASLAAASGVRGCVLRAPITRASNYRAAQEFDDWLKARGIIAITGVDTRALTALIREKGMPNAVIAHAPDGKFDLGSAEARACSLPRHGRARPRQGRDERPELWLGRDRVALERRLWARDPAHASMSSPSTMA